MSSKGQESITCPKCGRTSYHPDDIKQGYCGYCHWWTSDPQLSKHYKEVYQSNKSWSNFDETMYNICIYISRYGGYVIGALAAAAWIYVSFWMWLLVMVAFLAGGISGMFHDEAKKK